MLDTENTCAVLPETTEGNKFLDRQFNESKKFFLFDKLAHLVSGQAIECRKERTMIKTYKDFFRPESIETKTVVVKVSKVECEYMRVTKMCGDNLMRCENEVCSSSNNPLETYSWLQEISTEVLNCEIQNRFITADDEDSVVFNNNLCVVKYGECQLARSIVIWDMNIVHKCPFYLITAVNAEIHKNDILLAYEEKLLFSISDKISSKSCGDIKMLSSTEGLFITQDVGVLDLPKFDRDIMDLSKFMLSDTDLSNYKMTRINKRISQNVCVNTINMLDFAKIFKNEYFIFKDFRGNELVLYSKYNKLWVAKCYSVLEVSLDQMNNSECFQDMKITFKINNETLKGYMGENLIIKNNSVLVDCQSIDQLLFLKILP